MCRNVAALGLLLYAWREAGCAPSDAQLARYAHVPYFQDGRFQAWRELPYMPEKRRGRAALAREELPPLDFVLITHDHYDHLEAATIRHFARQATVPRFIVPLGLGVRLQGWGIPADKITELGWAESTTAGAIILTAVPAGAFG
ncbi:MAG: MBL fold metallo-hydrolase [Rhodocyclaceae bacterium]|nr:MBL fold metallo-hydrolase [Rhodocyclaceae bacterium]